ncbi:ATPase, AAA family protein [Xylogone sp. PMI_703]|nr:ATPase, AAA family protein [Xylogone sp. PMI_703]
MQYQGLEEVKQQFLDIKTKVDICNKQGRDLSEHRFNIVFQGNPGTGKTTVARLYAQFMHEMEILPSSHIKETSGVQLAAKGTKGTKKVLKKMLMDAGGVLFVDEAYQLISSYSSGNGHQALDIILTYMENNIGELVAIFVGYKDEMESFYEHNAGLSSRIPYTMTFSDFTDGQLLSILCANIEKRYQGKMKAEGGLEGLYMRIVIRRLGQARGNRCFGNARAVENLLDQIEHRQARRLAQQKVQGADKINYFEFTKEDLIGPDPSEAAKQCLAWSKLQELIGIEQVKDNVPRMIGLLNANYKRELNEQKPLAFSLNCLFVGAPGTGKTTVAKLYGQILADLGYLSHGDVIIKTPADFIGESLGSSEAKTKQILESTIGKVLVIDEAYMLDAGDPQKGQDPYKCGVIDTIVSMVHGVPGDDRCIILIGYEDRLRNMFRNMNPGLSRRFSASQPFRFDNFTLDELKEILQHKLKDEELTANDEVIKAFCEVLEQTLTRSDFSNAAEIDTVLATAKMNYEERQSRLPSDRQTYDGKLESSDINIKYSKTSPANLNYEQKFGGLVHKNIIGKLVRYQERYNKAKGLGWKPRESIPTGYCFRGPRGTGKSTTAKLMGEVFHDMGILSTTEVIECSASELLGQYVGQTAPKTRNKLNEGLGRILFIDEAHQLLQNQYAAEALDELIYFLHQPANLGRAVVILASRIETMNQLMTMRPELSSIFSEDIVFEHIPPADCITMLERELRRENIACENDFLSDTTSSGYAEVKDVFGTIQAIPSWSNARDVKSLTRQIKVKILDMSDRETRTIKPISSSLVIDCMNEMIVQQKSRITLKNVPRDSPRLQQLPLNSGTDKNNNRENREDKKYDNGGNNYRNYDNEPTDFAALSQKEITPLDWPPLIKKIFNVPHTTTSSRDVQAVVPQTTTKMPATEAQVLLKRDRQPDKPDKDNSQDNGDDNNQDNPGEPEVEEEIWCQLQQAKKEEIQRRAELDRLEEELRKAKSNNRNQLLAKCDAIRKEIQHDEEVQKALKEMGVCTMGYEWTKVSGGYRCKGGSHFVSDDKLP